MGTLSLHPDHSKSSSHRNHTVDPPSPLLVPAVVTAPRDGIAQVVSSYDTTMGIQHHHHEQGQQFVTWEEMGERGEGESYKNLGQVGNRYHQYNDPHNNRKSLDGSIGATFVPVATVCHGE